MWLRPSSRPSERQVVLVDYGRVDVITRRRLGSDALRSAAEWLIANHVLFQGGALIEPGDETFILVRNAKWEEIKGARDAAEAAGVEVPPYGKFDTNPQSLLKITGAALEAVIKQMQGVPYSRVWTRFDDTSIELTGEQLIQVGSAVAAYVDSVHQIGRDLRAQIYDLGLPLQDVMEISWPTS